MREAGGNAEFLSFSWNGIALLPYPCCSNIGYMHKPELYSSTRNVEAFLEKTAIAYR